MVNVTYICPHIYLFFFFALYSSLHLRPSIWDHLLLSGSASYRIFLNESMLVINSLKFVVSENMPSCALFLEWEGVGYLLIGWQANMASSITPWIEERSLLLVCPYPASADFWRSQLTWEGYPLHSLPRRRSWAFTSIPLTIEQKPGVNCGQTPSRVSSLYDVLIFFLPLCIQVLLHLPPPASQIQPGSLPTIFSVLHFSKIFVCTYIHMCTILLCSVCVMCTWYLLNFAFLVSCRTVDPNSIAWCYCKQEITAIIFFNIVSPSVSPLSPSEIPNICLIFSFCSLYLLTSLVFFISVSLYGVFEINSFHITFNSLIIFFTVSNLMFN